MQFKLDNFLHTFYPIKTILLLKHFIKYLFQMCVPFLSL